MIFLINLKHKGNLFTVKFCHFHIKYYRKIQGAYAMWQKLPSHVDTCKKSNSLSMLYRKRDIFGQNKWLIDLLKLSKFSATALLVAGFPSKSEV